MSGFADFPLVKGLTAVVDPLIPGIVGATTLVVAKRSGRHFIGFERDKNYFESATARLNSEDAPRLF